jgi:hypothetical protein
MVGLTMSEGAVSDDLDALLAKARDAEPSDRIELRDALAGHGENAIEAMTEWLGDPRLAAFAIRVLERIGRQPESRTAVLDVLMAVDREELPPHLAGDVDRALDGLGHPKADARAGLRRSRSGASARPPGMPGVVGRGYWVMRTSQWERPYIWAEAERGRLRQGWGWNAEMNLEIIAEAVRRGGELSDEQRMSWRSRRMRSTAPDGMRLGDIVAAPNIPVWGVLSVFRVTGSYEYSLDAPRQWDERFGHILPVELLAPGIDRRSPRVSDGLRSMLSVQTRLYNISGYGGDVERLLGNELPKSGSTRDRQGENWLEREYEILFGRFPPTGERPTDDQIAALAAELGRTFDAISWQWGDGKAYCSGGPASTTSDPLKAWLDRTGACEQ